MPILVSIATNFCSWLTAIFSLGIFISSWSKLDCKCGVIFLSCLGETCELPPKGVGLEVFLKRPLRLRWLFSKCGLLLRKDWCWLRRSRSMVAKDSLFRKRLRSGIIGITTCVCFETPAGVGAALGERNLESLFWVVRGPGGGKRTVLTIE